MSHTLISLRNKGHFLSYCLLTGAVAFCASLTMGTVSSLSLSALASHPEAIPRRVRELDQPGLLINVIVFAPLVETLLYQWLLILLTRYSRLPIAMACASVLAGAAHGPYPNTFAATSAAFLLYAVAWHHWRSVSYQRSYWAPAIAHAISNALIMVVAFTAP
jgi:membrane protease YdiL (CAAX protease family)